VQDN